MTESAQYHETPSQTVGPFFAVMLDWPDGCYAVPEGTDGAFWVRGTLFDGADEPIPDGMIELWQAGDTPRFARCRTDARGAFGFLTVRPEALGAQAPHLALSVFARGLIDRVVTRVYFPDQAAANAGDPALVSLPDDESRASLIATADGDGYRFDIHLQGDHETTFFRI
jgi:protocatechuate 3,4-dioxygenase, alpha subunit